MLDTNTCVFAIRGARKNNSMYRHIFDRIRSQEGIAISSLVLAELLHGVELSESSEKNRSALDDFLCALEILPFDSNAAEQYGIIRADLQKRGCLIEDFDILIAAHAMSNGAVLVTNNTKDFERVRGLELEDWKENK